MDSLPLPRPEPFGSDGVGSLPVNATMNDEADREDEGRLLPSEHSSTDLGKPSETSSVLYNRCLQAAFAAEASARQLYSDGGDDEDAVAGQDGPGFPDYSEGSDDAVADSSGAVFGDLLAADAPQRCRDDFGRGIVADLLEHCGKEEHALLIAVLAESAPPASDGVRRFWSRGARLHAVDRCRLCYDAIACPSGCPHGEECGFCHLPHMDQPWQDCAVNAHCRRFRQALEDAFLAAPEDFMGTVSSVARSNLGVSALVHTWFAERSAWMSSDVGRRPKVSGGPKIVLGL